MKRLFVVAALITAAVTFTYTGSAEAYGGYLNGVNNDCNTNFGCGLCHVDPGGGGPLTGDGAAWGGDNTYFCPVDPGPGDPPACLPETEICGDGIDNDCDGLVDGDDPDCPAPPPVCVPAAEICSDGIDNDCDGLIDGNDGDCTVPGPVGGSDGSDSDSDSDSDDSDSDGSDSDDERGGRYRYRYRR